MIRTYLTIGLFMTLSIRLFAQGDSLSRSVNLSLMGQHQSGNLNSISLNPRAQIRFQSPDFSADLESSYQLLRVEGFTMVSDFWTEGLYQRAARKKFFPALALVSGFAKSYDLQSSLHLSAGMGFNVLKWKPNEFLQVHALVGYLRFEFNDIPAHSTAALGLALRASFPVSKTSSLSWKLKTYHSLSNKNFVGGDNLFLYHISIGQSFGLRLSHNIIFNNQTGAQISRINSVFLFGFDFKLHQ